MLTLNYIKTVYGRVKFVQNDNAFTGKHRQNTWFPLDTY